MPTKIETVDGHVPLRGTYQQTGCAAATSLPSVPDNATMAWITVEGANVRWRDDGVAPTATVGNPVLIGMTFAYTAELKAIQFIQQSATATLNISYYGT